MPERIFGTPSGEAQIRARREELFPPEKPWVHVLPKSQHLFGTSTQHCESCPLKPEENCSKACDKMREELEKADGVKVY